MNPPSIWLLKKYLPARPFDFDEEKFSYDMMSNSVIWKDEANMSDAPVEVLNFMREIWAYRAGLIRSEQLNIFRESWNYLRVGHPQWIGFQDHRITPQKEIVSFLKTNADAALRELDGCFD